MREYKQLLDQKKLNSNSEYIDEKDTILIESQVLDFLLSIPEYKDLESSYSSLSINQTRDIIVINDDNS